jgi:hypothetical protein
MSPATRRPSQLGALGAGTAQLARAALPCLAAAAAIAIGSLALAVPGLLLLVLLSLTGASAERRPGGVVAALRDGLAAARAHLPTVAITVVAMLALDAAIAIVATRMFGAPLPRRPSPQQLATAHHLVHAIALGLVVLSPLPATVLATIRTRSR